MSREPFRPDQLMLARGVPLLVAQRGGPDFIWLGILDRRDKSRDELEPRLVDLTPGEARGVAARLVELADELERK